MRRILVLAAFLAAPALAAPQASGWTVLPAMRSAGIIYAIRTDAAGKIVKCFPVERGPIPSEIDAACAGFAAKGVPATLTPARSASDPATWVTQGDVPAGAAGTIQLIVEVDGTGRISDCQAYPASANEPLETAACAALKARARFTPAMYKGAPAVAVGVQSLTFAKP